MKDFKLEVASILKAKIESLSLNEILELIEVPKYSHMGDYAFPCFKLAKEYRKAPQMISAELAEGLSNDEFDKIASEGPYVNFHISRKEMTADVISEVAEKADAYGRTEDGKGKKVVVEFSSVNIAKAFHMGHIRSTMIGNAINNIYDYLGYETVAVNHLGDYGTQFGKLIVAYKKWGDKEAIEKDQIKALLALYVKFHDEAENDPSLEDEARAWFTRLENGDEEAKELWNWFKDVSMVEFNRVYDKLGVKFDSYAGESFYSDKMPAVLSELRASEIMNRDEGAEVVDLSEFNMPNALVTKSDGSSLYITRDLAAAIYRKDTYDFHKNIYVVGAAQKLHFTQLFKILDMMGKEWHDDCVHVEFGLVSLEEGSMSTRKGKIVFLEDVLDTSVKKTLDVINEKNPSLENKEEVARQVGVGAVVFNELSNNRIKDYVFSWEDTLSFEGETGPYLQYTHARCSSLIERSGLKMPTDVDYSLILDDKSFEVVRTIRKFTEFVRLAAEKYEPAVISRYLIDLAKEFNRFYQSNPVVTEDAELTKARVQLVWSVRQTLKNGLGILGLSAPDRM